MTQPPAAASNVRLELTWPGKDKFLLTPTGQDGKPVWVERDHPAATEVRLATVTGCYGNADTTAPDVFGENLLFTGDSLDVLRILRDTPEYAAHYRGKIRQIFIDPPFNSGNTFTHYDDWMEHSTWLSFMRERLIIARDLLAEDGSIWVQLDDVEEHRMRCLLDEVFGARNFLARIEWQRRRSREGRAAFSASCDHILVYGRVEPSRWKKHRNTLPSDPAGYKNPDDDPRGPWKPIPLTAQGYRPNQMYEITTPSGRQWHPPKGGCWRYLRETLDALIENDRIYWGATGNNQPVRKRFLYEDTGLVPETLWVATTVGDNPEGKREILTMFPDTEAFATPKPERLLERVIHIGSNPGDIVMDVFAGSGTTAAVAHKMGRRWVTAELNPDTVEAFTRPRLSKVVNGDDPGGITEKVEWAGGGGFVDVQVCPSMYEVTPAGVLLAEWATNGQFARAVAAQLGFTFQPDATPLCGRRGRMRLAVFDGAVGPEEAREAVGALGEGDRVTIVAKVVLPGAEEALAGLSRGSRVLKAPRDLLVGPRRRG